MNHIKLISILFFSFLLLGCLKKEEEPEPKEEEPVVVDPNYHLGSLGTAANDLLSDSTYKSLTIEIVYVKGNKLQDATLTNAKTFLESRLNKPGGINFISTEIESPGLAPYSNDDIRQVEDDVRSQFTSEDNITAFLFVADGNYADNDNVLGVAYRNTSMALFNQKIDAVSGGVGQPSAELLETTVFHHELGHILGLVNIGSEMQANHQDTANGHHCDVDDCLMYWAVETGDFISNLIGETSPPQLDAQCIADLKANGGK